MDRAKDVLYIDITSADDTLIDFFVLLARYKELEVESANLFAEYAPAITYRGIQIEGLWPCIWYLIDIRPYPEILPETPQKRAIILTLTDRVLTGHCNLDELSGYYRTTHGKFALKPRLYLLDFAVAALARNPETVRQHPWLRSIGIALNRSIEQQQEGRCA